MRIADLAKRVEAVEGDITEVRSIINDKVLPEMQGAKTERLEMQQDLKTIIAIVSGAEKVGGFLARHGKVIVTFGAGLMTALGIGNPDVWRFISTFNFSGG